MNRYNTSTRSFSESFAQVLPLPAHKQAAKSKNLPKEYHERARIFLVSG